MLILTGASASGKTVTALNLQERYGFSKAVTTTTRKMRDGEQNGKDYFFLSIKEFQNKLSKGGFVESSLYNGNYYGCGVDQVSDNKVIVLDPNGVKSFQKLNDKNIIVVFLYCDSKIREERMRGRGDLNENIAKRLSNDETSFSDEIINGLKCDLRLSTENKTVDEVADIINSFYRSKVF